MASSLPAMASSPRAPAEGCAVAAGAVDGGGHGLRRRAAWWRLARSTAADAGSGVGRRGGGWHGRRRRPWAPAEGGAVATGAVDGGWLRGGNEEAAMARSCATGSRASAGSTRRRRSPSATTSAAQAQVGMAGEGSAPIAVGKAASARRWRWPWPPASSSRAGWRKKKSQGHFRPGWHFGEDTLVEDGIPAKPVFIMVF
uniref:Uncharacterized protein n=2 Tax=Oryza sativa subsp. japonica TaxID=39947 RepID=Q8GZX7_ORYSJ|nr:Hypothetical protein [Oryza sativa Japonica Group]ABF93621.1 hypothetical protein LOC_Os03g02230 [Oryza sativa Japonica Group]